MAGGSNKEPPGRWRQPDGPTKPKKTEAEIERDPDEKYVIIDVVCFKAWMVWKRKLIEKKNKGEGE
jgi:hypothetical protein